VNSASASSSSQPFVFTIVPGHYFTLPLDMLYTQYYDISCTVKDSTNLGNDSNAINISSTYRPHTISVDDKIYGSDFQMPVKTKMTGSTLQISRVRNIDDKITFENLDFTDTIAFTCTANLVTS
jgi:hypothetical protein